MKLVSPSGADIIGTLEVITATAMLVNANIVKEDGGTYDFEYEGDSEIDWDSQRTIKRQHQRVFVDEDGQEWIESQLLLIEDEEDEGCPHDDPGCLSRSDECHDTCKRDC